MGLATLFGVIFATGASADTLIRLATFHTDLSRNGPGVLLRDLHDPDDEQINATVAVIAEADADILVLQDVDYDAAGAALDALAQRLTEAGTAYAHRFALRPNTGMPTGFDLDGDGDAHGRRDSQGYGSFSGQGGMAVLSRFPISDVRDFSTFLWADLPDGDAALVTPAEALPVLRLATVAAWDVTITLPDGTPFHLLTLHASPPVFDGPEDRNGRRNADELRFWRLYLDGWSPDGRSFQAEHFALIGTFNLDPARGEGRRDTLTALLDHPNLQDPAPTGGGGTATADWDEPTPGNLRVDYILPSRTVDVTSSAVLWPRDEHEGILPEIAAVASDHRLVWVDIRAR